MATPRRADLTGQRFVRWLVVAYAGKRPPSRSAYWLCRCDCGAEKVISAYSLKRGDSKSCRCLHKELCGSRAKKIFTTHGHCVAGRKRSVEYGTWMSMKDRCHNPNSEYYYNYGGSRYQSLRSLAKQLREFSGRSHARDRASSFARIQHRQIPQ